MARLVNKLTLIMFLALAALVCTEVVLYSQNFTVLHTEWILRKRTMRLELLSSTHALLSRALVAAGAFRGDAWFAFQEIDTRAPFTPSELSFRFRLPLPGSNVSVLFGGGGSGSSGVRLSRHADLPPMAFTAAPDETFLTTRAAPALRVFDGDWHRARLRFTAEGTSLALDDAASVPVLGPEAKTDGTIGFRGGFTQSEVSGIEIRSRDGSVWREDFANRAHFGALYAAHAALLALMAALLFFPGGGGDRRYFRAGAFLLFVCVFGAAYGLFDRYFWSKTKVCALDEHLVPNDRELTLPIRLVHAAEKARFFPIDAWHRLVTGAGISRSLVAEAGYPEQLLSIWGGSVFCGASQAEPCRRLGERETEAAAGRPKSGPRLLFVGTSQTFGSGAPDLDRTFFARTVRALQAGPLRGRGLEAMNISVIAGRGAELLAIFRRLAPRFRPDAVVVVLSANDGHEAVRANNRAFLEYGRDHGIRTVLLTEAYAFESFAQPYSEGRRILPNGREAEWRDQIKSKHGILYELGKEFSAPVLPFEEFLNSPETRDRGFLWWDLVHLSEAGHRIAAEWLAPRLATILASKPAGGMVGWKP